MATTTLSPPALPDDPSSREAKALARQYLEEDAARKKKESEARAIGKRQAKLAEQLMAYVREHAPKKPRVTQVGDTSGRREGYELAIESKQRQPGWKGELEKAIGLAKVEALKEKQPYADKLRVAALHAVK